MQLLSARDFELLDAMVATAAGDTGLVAEVLAQSAESPLPVATVLQRIETLRATRSVAAPASRYWPHAPVSTRQH